MMRANRLFTLATIAVLMGGTSLVVGQEMRGRAGGGMNGGAGGGPVQGGGMQSGGPVQGGGMQRGGSMGGGTVGQAPSQGGSFESRGPNARGAQGPTRRSEMPGERGSNIRGAQGPERGRATSEERGRFEERGRMGAEERGRVEERGRIGANERGRLEERGRFSERGRLEERGQFGADLRGRLGERARAETTGRAPSTRTDEVGVSLSSEQRRRIHDMVLSRRNIPRVSNPDVDIRVNSVIPRSVRLAAVPEDVVRIYPRFRGRRVFVYGDEIVIVDPVTFRIVAVLPA